MLSKCYHDVKKCVDGQFDEHGNSINTMSDSQAILETTQFWELEALEQCK